MALEVLLDDNGQIKACCEWLPFNREGVIHEDGDVIGISKLVISRGTDLKSAVRYFTTKILARNPDAKLGFFYRRLKYPDSPEHFHPRESWERLVQGGNHG